MGAIAMLRTVLKKAQKTKQLITKEKKVPEEIDPVEDTVLSVINKEVTLRVHVHKEDDIIALLRLRDEFDLRITIEHACDVHNKEIFDMLRTRGISVTYGPTDSFAYKAELKHENVRNIKHLIESGVKFAVMSDHPVTLQRNLFLQLRHFRKLGLSREECISKITGESADILNTYNLGRLAKNKLASFVCWNADPFSLESYPLEVYGEGNLVYKE
jgi:imidazolonepropionase-like amidohydrolase